MTAKEQGLPELPEPFGSLERTGMWNGSMREGRDDVYDADQMRAYALAALAPDTGERGVVAWLHEVAADGGEPDQALSFSRNSFPLEGVAGYRTTSVRPLYAHPQAQASAPGECGDGLADCPFCGGPPAYVGGETTGYEVRCGHCGGKSGWGDYGYQASAKWNRRAGYSLDADPRGIRSAAADAITGALALGAQGNNRPPNGHWLLPFWEAARADALRAQPAGGGEVVSLMDKFRALVAAHDGEFAFVDGVKLCLRELEAAIAGCQPGGRELPKHFVECSESEKAAYMRGVAVGEKIAFREPVFAALDSVVPGWRERGSDTASAAATAITELSARATSNGAKPFRWDDDEGEAPSAWGPK